MPIAIDEERLSETFAALSNSTRRAILARLAEGAAILLSHTHWDHIQGLGFFPPVFIAGNQFTVWGPGGSPKVLRP